MKSSSKPKQHFVFDLDDTLTDARDFCGESMARTITKLEPHQNPTLIKMFHDSIRGATVVDLYKKAIQEFKLKSTLKSLIEIDQHIQKTEFHRIKVFDGVIEMLEFLRAKGKGLHICTNRVTETMIPILKYNNIYDYFDTITSCIDAGAKKPDPQCLRQLISKYDDDQSEFIYFGDSEVDREFAKNGGIDFIVFDQYLNDKTLFLKLINLFIENGGSPQSSPEKLVTLRKQLTRLQVKLLSGSKILGKEISPLLH